MAVEVDTNGGGGGNVLIAVAIVGFFMWDNYKSHVGASAPTATITVKKN
jgi:hypothetical protein